VIEQQIVQNVSGEGHTVGARDAAGRGGAIAHGSGQAAGAAEKSAAATGQGSATAGVAPDAAKNRQRIAAIVFVAIAVVDVILLTTGVIQPVIAGIVAALSAGLIMGAYRLWKGL
jgi:hypothetical protein